MPLKELGSESSASNSNNGMARSSVNGAPSFLSREKALLIGFLESTGFTHLYAWVTGRTNRTLSGLDKKAVAAWEGLNTSPFATVDIPVRRADGSTVIRRTSVAKLGLIGASAQTTRTELEGVLRTALDAGIVSRQPTPQSVLNFNWRGYTCPRGARYSDPRSFLSLIPNTDGTDSGLGATALNPLGIPPDYPKIKPQSIAALYPTEKLVNASQFSNAEFDALMERALSAVSAYLKDRNCNPGAHPLVTALLQPNLVPSQGRCDSTVNYHDIAVSSLGNPAVLVPSDRWNRFSLRGYRPQYATQPGAFRFVITGTTDPRWVDSRARRVPTLALGVPGNGELPFHTGGPTGYRDISTTQTDAVADLLGLLQLVSALEQLGRTDTYAEGITVDLTATCQAYNSLLRASYIQIGRPYGSDFADFQRYLSLEAAERDRKARNSALRFTGATFSASGNDAADIGAGIMSTVTTALALGTAVGGPYGAAVGVIAGVLLGSAAAIAFLLGSEAPRDPSAEPLKFPSGVNVWGLTPKDVFQSWPVCRYSEGDR